jgi:hypothetical protein
MVLLILWYLIGISNFRPNIDVQCMWKYRKQTSALEDSIVYLMQLSEQAFLKYVGSYHGTYIWNAHILILFNNLSLCFMPLTNWRHNKQSMTQDIMWAIVGYFSDQEICSHLWNTNVHDISTGVLHLVPIPSQINPPPHPHITFLLDVLYHYLHLCFTVRCVLFRSGYTSKIPYIFLISPMHAAHISLFDSITLIIVGESTNYALKCIIIKSIWQFLRPQTALK